ncbi:MAG: dihydrolipoyl dehydrogenase [Pseudomonadota bacterium]
MNKRNVDVAVIGAGSAGLRAYRAAKKETDSAVLIEGGPYGTTCARVGCMPSKLLIAAAEAAHGAAEARRFGVDVGPIQVNGRAVMERVRRERDRFVGFVVEGTESIPAEDRIRGYARFIDDHQLQIDDHTLVHASRVVIATGSRPAYPGAWNELGDRLLVNDDIFDWQDLPASVAVFGPGVIGLELGQALSRLGVEVLTFGRGGQVGPLSDPKVMAAGREAFAREFHLNPDANVSRMERTENGVAIDYEAEDGSARSTAVDFVIAATGRTPNVDRLGLENTSLPLDERGVHVFDPLTMQVGSSHVFIAGDVDNDRPLLHEAADEGEIAGRNAARFPAVEPGLRRSPLAVVFSDPQMAMVGASFADLNEADLAIGEVSFEDQGRARVMLKNQGLLRVYADCRTGRFLGAEMVGPRAEHIGHLLAWAHQARLTIAEMLDMPFYHPVIEEGLRTALRDAQKGVGRCLRLVA